MYESLKKKMEENRYSALALARKTGINPGTFAYRLSGGGEWTVSEAAKIALILGIKPGDYASYFTE